MSKKLIASMLVVTTLFVCVFAACQKKEEDDRQYIAKNEYPFVTDENGEKVYNENGEFIVYVTDENGRKVKDKNGEYETVNQQFQPIEDKGVFEDYGYKIKLPSGWKVNDDAGSFINKAKKQEVQIDAVNKDYSEYYRLNKDLYKQLKDQKGVVSIKWEEDVEISKDCKDVVRFTMVTEDQAVVMYFYKNNNNLYKVLFRAEKPDTIIEDSMEICKAITYKPFEYFPVITTEAE